MQNNYVLGGGVAGLIWTFYNPEYTIISDNVGGQFNAPFSLGPRLLHCDNYTKRFLFNLKCSPKIKHIKVGYFYNDTINDTNTEENRLKYFKKTRGENEPYSSSMSGNLNEYDAYDIEDYELVHLMLQTTENKIIRDKIETIDITNKKITTLTDQYSYDNIVSTIPLNVFLFLSGNSDLAKQFKSFPTSFFLIDKLDYWFDNTKIFDEYDYVYVSDEKYPFHRITKTLEGYVLEAKGNAEIRHINKFVLPTGQLIHNDINLKFDSIKFFGRYAEWNHSIKINELLKKIYAILTWAATDQCFMKK